MQKLSYETQCMHIIGMVVYVHHTCICVLRLYHIPELLKMLIIWEVDQWKTTTVVVYCELYNIIYTAVMMKSKLLVIVYCM